MDLKIKDKEFIVCGASSGFGLSISKGLIQEGAKVIAVARSKEKLEILMQQNGKQIEIFQGDLTLSGTISKLKDHIGNRVIDGIVINAGGPPAKSFLETSLEDWDSAYSLLLRWKIEIVKTFLPKMQEQKYGRLLFIESASIKQPMQNLVLSTSMRLAVAGFAKTLAYEVANQGITLNVMAPGYHDTAALDRIFDKRSQLLNISKEEAKRKMEQEIPTGKLGSPEEFASLAIWLLSPNSGYITGQTISIDGGLIKYIFG